jgi:hypothetical protein
MTSKFERTLYLYMTIFSYLLGINGECARTERERRLLLKLLRVVRNELEIVRVFCVIRIYRYSSCTVLCLMIPVQECSYV